MSFLSLIWFRSKTLQVLLREMNYNVATPGHQAEPFNRATRTAHENGYNEYTAAITFMLDQLSLLSRPLNGQTRNFYFDKLSELRGISNRADHGDALIQEFIKNHYADFQDEATSHPHVVKETTTSSPPLPGFEVEFKPQTVEDRLLQLKLLLEKELITQQQYEVKSAEIISNI